MMTPKLTVGISFYNTRDTIHDLARSIFSQTFTDWEWILIDDGSTDGGIEVAKKIQDPRVQVICDGKNKGRSYRYNQITKMARGEYIARFDADDICDPVRFEKQVEFLDSHPEVDVVGTDRFSLAPGDILKGRRNEPPTHAEICRNPLRRGIYICHGGVIGRKTWFEKHPYPEEFRIAIDAALWVSSWQDSTFANIPGPYYYYREFETYSFKKYLKTNLAIIRIIWNYGPRSHGMRHILSAIAARLGRIGIYGGMSALHLQDHLVGSRSAVLTPEDEKQFRKAYETIRATPVPGLNES